MSTGSDHQVLHYPFPLPSALEPPPEWARLRESCPAATVRLASGDEAVLLTRHEDVRAVLSDPRFSRNLGAADAARVTANESGGVFGGEPDTIESGADHQRWRGLVGRWFTARRMTAMRPRIAATAERLVEEMVGRGAPGDVLSGVGFPLTVQVICDMLGVPADDRHRFAYWSDTLLSLTQYAQDEIDAAQAEFHAYLSTLIAAKRADPGEDLLGELLRVSDADDGRLSEEELLITAIGLLVAGHETTANMIGKMVAVLLADRSRWEALVADPSLVRTAVEEVLRLDADPGFGMPRYLSADVELPGATLPRGTTVICSMAAANRDGAARERAEEMDLARSPNAHLGFGAGPYSCIGQALARTELQTALEVLLRRLPSLELAVPARELRRREGLLVGGLVEVPVRW